MFTFPYRNQILTVTKIHDGIATIEGPDFTVRRPWQNLYRILRKHNQLPLNYLMMSETTPSCTTTNAFSFPTCPTFPTLEVRGAGEVSGAAPLCGADVYKQCFPSVGTLVNGCTCFAIEHDGEVLILTAAHCIDPTQESHRAVFTGTGLHGYLAIQMSVKHYFEALDVAVLDIQGEDTPPGLKLTLKALRTGEKAYVIGNADAQEANSFTSVDIRENIVHQPWCHMGLHLLFTGPIFGGNSGSPLLNCEGEVVGLVQCGLTGDRPGLPIYSMVRTQDGFQRSEPIKLTHARARDSSEIVGVVDTKRTQDMVTTAQQGDSSTRVFDEPLDLPYGGRILPFKTNFAETVDAVSEEITISSEDPFPILDTRSTANKSQTYPDSTSPDIGYTFLPLEQVTIHISTCSSETNFDTRLMVYSVDGNGEYTLLSFNDDSECPLNRSNLEHTFDAETSYRIVVSGFEGQTGTYRIYMSDSTSSFTATLLGEDGSSVDATYSSNGYLLPPSTATFTAYSTSTEIASVFTKNLTSDYLGTGPISLFDNQILMTDDNSHIDSYNSGAPAIVLRLCLQGLYRKIRDTCTYVPSQNYIKDLSRDKYGMVCSPTINEVVLWRDEGNAVESLVVNLGETMNPGQTIATPTGLDLVGSWKIIQYGVGPSPGSFEYFTYNTGTNPYYDDDRYIFQVDGQFENTFGPSGTTQLEEWQAEYVGEGLPVAPHDNSEYSTYTLHPPNEEEENGLPSITLNGKGSFIGLPKAINGAEISDNENVPDSRTYDVLLLKENELHVMMPIQDGLFWTFILAKDTSYVSSAPFDLPQGASVVVHISSVTDSMSVYFKTLDANFATTTNSQQITRPATYVFEGLQTVVPSSIRMAVEGSGEAVVDRIEISIAQTPAIVTHVWNASTTPDGPDGDSWTPVGQLEGMSDLLEVAVRYDLDLLHVKLIKFTNMKETQTLWHAVANTPVIIGPALEFPGFGLDIATPNQRSSYLSEVHIEASDTNSSTFVILWTSTDSYAFITLSDLPSWNEDAIPEGPEISFTIVITQRPTEFGGHELAIAISTSANPAQYFDLGTGVWMNVGTPPVFFEFEYMCKVSVYSPSSDALLDKFEYYAREIELEVSTTIVDRVYDGPTTGSSYRISGQLPNTSPNINATRSIPRHLHSKKETIEARIRRNNA